MNTDLVFQQYKKKHRFADFNPQTVLFDMDGVIFDSMPNHATAWQEAMKLFGLNITQQEVYLFEGMRGVETIQHIALKQMGKQLTEEEAGQMYKEKSRLFAAQGQPPQMPGILQLFRQIKQDGMKIGVVTGSGQHTLLQKLEETFPGLLHKQFIVTSFDVKHGKPDPEPYLQALRKTHTQPWQAIVVENAPLGVRAAVAANIFTIAVNTGPLPDHMLWDEGANLVFSSIQQLNQEWANLKPR